MCDKGPTSGSGLKSHKVSHAKVKTFKCHMCSRKFLHKADLTHHFATHTELKDAIKTHEKSKGNENCKKGEGPLRKEMNVQSSIKNEVIQDLELEEFSCDTYGLAFGREDEVKEHTRTHVVAKACYACHKCNMKFTQKKKLLRHILSHNIRRNFHCTSCSEVFADVATLKLHAEIHLPLIGMKCKFCGKKLLSMFDLHTHGATHCKGIVKEKGIRCKVCSSEFFQEAELNKHNMAHCQIVKVFKCHLCEEKFPLKENLKIHMVEHMVRKAYRCRYCDKTFSQNSDLVAHMVAHSWMDDFECHVCKKTFERKMDLNRHAIQHTKVRYYRCEVCDKDILWKSNYEKHMERHGQEIFAPKKRFMPWDVCETIDNSAEVDPLFIGNRGSSSSREARVHASSSIDNQLKCPADVVNDPNNVVFIKREYDEDMVEIIKEEDGLTDKDVLGQGRVPGVPDAEISSSSSSVLNKMKLDRPIKTEIDKDNVVYVNCDFDANLPIKEEVCTW